MFGASQGAAAPAFGAAPQQLFGQQQQQPAFGSAFGAPAQPAAQGVAAPAFGPGGFGAAPAQGLFGQQQQQQPSQPANTAASGLFGQQQPQQNAAIPGQQQAAFGSSAFGVAPPGASAFGQQAAGSSLFGARPASNPYGTAQSAAPNMPTSAFGAPSQSTGAFGAAAPSMFGAAAPGAGLMGANASQQTTPQANNGTGNPPFQEILDKDPNGTVTGKFQSISIAPAYQNWSFEELRYQDYLTNKKFAGAAPNNAAAPNTGLSAFGQPATSAFSSAPGAARPGFGAAPGAATTTAPGLFSGAGAFGASAATQPGQAGGLFGQQSAAAAPGFGAAATTTAPSLFGNVAAPAASGLGGGAFGFGQQQQQKPAFGIGAAAPGFGAGAAAAPTAFGQPAATTGASLFGRPAVSTGFGFGGAQPAVGAPTTSQPFGASGGLFGATTSAPAAGAFGAQPATTMGGGLFGANAAAGAAKPAFGFGQQAATTTAPTATGLFSSGAGAFGAGGGGLFGASATTTAPSAANMGPGGFALPGQGGLLGQTQAQPSAQQPGQTLGGGLFSTGGLGGAAAGGAGMFGAQGTMAPGGFGAGGFGGATSAGGGLFGGSTAAVSRPLGAFGFTGLAGTTTQPSMYGVPAASQPPTAGGGLFGGAAGGLFGSAPPTSVPLFGASAPGALSGLSGLAGYGAAQAGMMPQPTLQAKIDVNPYGYNPLLHQSAAAAAASSGASAIQTPARIPTTVEKKPAVASSLKVTPRSTAKIMLRGLFPQSQQSGPSLIEGQRGIPLSTKPGNRMLSHLKGSPRDPAAIGIDVRFTPRRSLKNLVIEDASEFISPGGNLVNATGMSSSSTPGPGSESGSATRRPMSSQPNSRRGVSFDPVLELNAEASLSHAHPSFDGPRTPLANVGRGSNHGSDSFMASGKQKTPNLAKQSASGMSSVSRASPAASHGDISQNGDSSEYVLSPSFENLLLMSDEELRHVKNFTVSISGIGSVKFLEPVDLLGATSAKTRAGIRDIPGNIVILVPKLCTVYPDEGTKPPVGSGLNVPAEISLERCWPVDRANRAAIMDVSDPRYQRHMDKLRNIPDTTWIGFDETTGTWTFKVEHFSRYGVPDDDDDDTTTAAGVAIPTGDRPLGFRNMASAMGSTTLPNHSAMAHSSTRRVTGHRVRITESHNRNTHTDAMMVQDVSVDASHVQDSMVHIRSRKIVSSALQPKRLFSDDDCDVMESGSDIMDRESLDDVREERDDVIVSDDQDVSDVGFEVNDEEEEDNGGVVDDDGDDDFDDVIAQDPQDGFEVRDTGAAFDTETPVKPSMSQLSMTTSTIKQMEIARSVQSMKASLFRSTETRGGSMRVPDVARSSSMGLGEMFSAPSRSSAEKRVRFFDVTGDGVSGFGLGLVAPRTDFSVQPHRLDDSVASVTPAAVATTTTTTTTHATETTDATVPFSPQKYQRTESLLAPRLPKQYLAQLPSMSTSLAYGKSRDVADAGFFMGRGFRVGWGPGDSFVVIGSATRLKVFSSVSIRNVSIFNTSASQERTKHLTLLNAALTHSMIQSGSTVLSADTDTAMIDERDHDGRVGPRSSVSQSSVSHRLYPDVDDVEMSVVGDNVGSTVPSTVPRARLMPPFEFSVAEKALAVLVPDAAADSVSTGDGVTHMLTESNNEIAAECAMWRLGSALWDTEPLEQILSQHKLTHAQATAMYAALRKERLSDWLIESIKPSVERDAIQASTAIERVFVLLSGRLVSRAVSDAVRNRDLRLATVLSQVNGSSARVAITSQAGVQKSCGSFGLPSRGGTSKLVLKLAQQQLDTWDQMREKRGDAFISPAYVSIWRLLAGRTGAWDDRVCPRDADWRRLFGLYFWYGHGGAWNLPAALTEYEAAFTQNKVARPVPAYAAGDVSATSLREFDVCFHLLKLASQPNYPLEAVLRPTAFSPRVLDHRLAWFLGQMLSATKHIRLFKDTPPPRASQAAAAFPVVGKSVTSDRVTLSFASQLETLGLWQWSAYVLLFLGTPQGRESALRDLLARRYPLDDASGSWRRLNSTRAAVGAPGGLFGAASAMAMAQPFGSHPLSSADGDVLPGGSLHASSRREKWSESSMSPNYVFLTEKLLIPVDWIHEARVLQARARGFVLQELVSLIDAQQYISAQRLLMGCVAPERIIAGQYNFLRAVVARIPEGAISDYDIGVGLIKRYITIMDSIPRELQLAQDPVSVSPDVSAEDLARARNLRRARRARLVATAQPDIRSTLATLSSDYLVKLRALLTGRSHTLMMDHGQDRMLTIAVSEMTARLSVLDTEISPLGDEDDDGVSDGMHGGGDVYRVSGRGDPIGRIASSGVALAAMPVVTDQRIAGLRPLASAWLDAALA